jgi:hypothetical protein
LTKEELHKFLIESSIFDRMDADLSGSL